MQGNWLRSQYRRDNLWAIALTLLLGCGIVTTATFPSFATDAHQVTAQASDLLSQGTQAYQAGQIQAAIALWKQVQTNATTPVLKIQAANYLGLAYPELGNWDAARTALNDSQQALAQLEHPQKQALIAQNINNQGHLAFLQGHTETALEQWQMAAKIYQKIKNTTGFLGSKMNQAQALQTLGQYRRSKDLLLELVTDLDREPDSQLTVQGLRNLGNAFFVIGDLEQAKVLFEASWAMGDRLNLPEENALTLIKIGTVAEAIAAPDIAFDYYDQAQILSQDSFTQLQGKLQQLRLQVQYGVDTDIESLIASIQRELANLPGDRRRLNAAIYFSESLLQADPKQPLIPPQQLATFLAAQRHIAITNADPRSEAFLLQQLGKLYSQQENWAIAESVTSEALNIAETLNAPDLIAQEASSLAEMYHRRGDRTQAIATYKKAVAALQELRSDLVAVNADIQFNLRDSAEPIYRDFVALLMEVPEPSQADLRLARDILENVQLAELDNFFQDACLDTNPIAIDQIDTQAAVFYPIILGELGPNKVEERLVVIASLPDDSFQSVSHTIDRSVLDQTLKAFYSSLYIGYSDTERLQLSQTIYDWLVRPLEQSLQQQQIETLVFVPDGFLRNIPMAALHDGDRYLIESYSLATSPGLQLFPQGLRQEKLTSLMGGLTEARQNFNALPGVQVEIDAITKDIDSTVLLNQDFTKDNLTSFINNRSYPIVHLATHGQFSSNPDETFLLTWDDTIGIGDLDLLFEKRRLGELDPIELLVLSACQTASGDDRATLGLAGLALRSGALSTLASLWSVHDQSTSVLMNEFYRALADNQQDLSKAAALRQAQLALLQDPKFQHPYYWSPFILVGNWL
ncbi:MAG: CHAT domain-containing protein [Limnothrix sp. RL_2_0]|nr:CHAT domain-containing protein [Limnothrix sp. RL_2_0]